MPAAAGIDPVTGIVMHDNDVVGPMPGSFIVGAKDHLGEAPLFPAAQILEPFGVRVDIERIRLCNSRVSEASVLKMRAGIAGLRTAAARIREFHDRSQAIA